MTPVQAPYPANRPRRLRASGALRDLVAETTLSPADLIWPVFVRDGEGVEEPVASMPGVMRRSIDAVRATFGAQPITIGAQAHLQASNQV